MRFRSYTLAFVTLIALLAGTIAGAQSPGIDSCQYFNSCDRYGFFVTCNVHLHYAGNSSGLQLLTDYGNGIQKTTFIAGSPLGALSTSQGRYYAPGRYKIRHVLNSYISKVDSVTNSVIVQCDNAEGELYHDANSDCMLSSNERSVNGPARIQVDSAGVHVDTITAYGHWSYKVLATMPTPYSFKLLDAPTGYAVSCPSSGIINYAFDPTIPTAPQHFAFRCGPSFVTDYELLYFRSLRGASSSGQSYVGLYAVNHSCYSGTANVTLQVSPKYNIVASGIRPAPASVSGHTVIWSLPGMSDGYYTQLYVPLTPLSTTHDGDTACTYAIINPISGDGNPANNVLSVSDTVLASWDPNEKSVLPIGPVSAGSLLTYTIDFENLGGDTAFNIHIQDTLAPHLDANTFQLIGATHRVVPYLYETAAGAHVIKFDFPDINLEAKTVPARNKGQVRFTIKMKNDLPDGTVIANRAGIYFDGNPVVMTNTTYNNIPLPSGVAHSMKGAVKIFPNPAYDLLHIEVPGSTWSDAVLGNSLGQVASRISLHAGGNILDIRSLPAGIYYLQIKGASGILTKKVEKQ